MIRLLKLGFAVNILLALGVEAVAQDAARPRNRLALSSDVAGPLVSKSVAEKLKLTKDQKDKIAKLEQEFAERTKEGAAKAREKMEKARVDRDRQAMKTALSELKEVKGLQPVYIDKVRELLNDEQKKLYTSADAEAPASRAGAAGLGLILQKAEERLGLSEEQKQKLMKLQKDFETKAMQILTEEQRRMYEQFKSRLEGRPQLRKRPDQSRMFSPRPRVWTIAI
jgi:Spy/CpxP family protein refolding chaperone